MDSIIAESSDTMINSSNFGLPETSQYITSRRFVNFFHQVLMSMLPIREIKTLGLTLVLMIITT